MGANIVPGEGVTFRVWAPNALEVLVSGDFNGWTQQASGQLVNDGQGHWTGFIPGLDDGAPYKFFIKGIGSTGYKRDPYARELTLDPQFPQSNCLVRSPGSYPWHDQGFQMAAFNDLIIYQFHIGTYYGTDAQGNDDRRSRMCAFLDVIDRLEYLADLGVNAIEPLPVVEFPTETSEGYNGLDYDSPEMAYTIPPGPGLDRYFNRVNQLLQARGHAPLEPGTLDTQVNQLKALVDVFHVYGIAVLLDVVGFRYDEVTVIDEHGGWSFCQNLTDTVHFVKDRSIHIAEFWMNDQSWVIRPTSAGGAGFDGVWSPRLRDGVRGAIGQAAGGTGAFVSLDAVRDGLYPPAGFPAAWRSVHCVENHDIVFAGNGPRVARLSDSNDSRSWYARSRARGDRPAPDGPWNPPHFHGPGVPRGQAMERQ